MEKKRETRSVARLCLAVGLLSASTARAGIVTVVPPPVADATIFEENGDSSDSKSPGLFAGRTSTDRIRRAFLRFNLTGIPAGVTVSSVQVVLSLTRANSGSVFASLYRVSAAWGEGTSDAGIPGGSGAPATAGDPTWTMRVYPGTAWTSPGGDTLTSVSATTLIGSSLVNYFWTTTPALLADVQGWINAPATNFGWQLRIDESQIAPTAKRFGSREQSDAALRPVLIVRYDDPAVGGAPVTAVPALDAPALLALAAVLAAGGAWLLRRGA
ncbi:MAG: DNRLRE domain-containing protein [Acidobacteriota bacterium]|nr:DNRLRE domain-containing protein [Acidobacteriota bacterium]